MNRNIDEMDFDELMNQALRLPDGDAKLAVLEQAARVADMCQDIEQGFVAREKIVELCTFSGHPLKALVAFSWLVGMKDKYPELLGDYSLLWKYKYILGYITTFPEINRTQIENLLEDMRVRFASEGYSGRTYYDYKFSILVDMGNIEEGLKCFELVQSMERDAMSNCRACEQGDRVNVQGLLGNDEALLEAAEPILTEKLKCHSSLQVNISRVLMPLLRLGRKEEADEWQRKGYRLIKGSREYLHQIALHIEYLTYTDPIKALEIFEENVFYLSNHENPEDIMYFSALASALFSRLTRENIQFDVRFPVDHPCAHLNHDVAALGQYYKDYAMDYAYKYDQRNGNNYCSLKIEKLSQFTELNKD